MRIRLSHNEHKFTLDGEFIKQEGKDHTIRTDDGQVFVTHGYQMTVLEDDAPVAYASPLEQAHMLQAMRADAWDEGAAAINKLLMKYESIGIDPPQTPYRKDAP